LAFLIFSEIIFLNTLASLITQQASGAVSGINNHVWFAESLYQKDLNEFGYAMYKIIV